MKPTTKKKRAIEDDNEILPHYDFTNTKRGNFHKLFKDGIRIVVKGENGKIVEEKMILPGQVIVVDDDVYTFFKSSAGINDALRHLMAAYPQKPKRKAA